MNLWRVTLDSSWMLADSCPEVYRRLRNTGHPKSHMSAWIWSPEGARKQSSQGLTCYDSWDWKQAGKAWSCHLIFIKHTLCGNESLGGQQASYGGKCLAVAGFLGKPSFFTLRVCWAQGLVTRGPKGTVCTGTVTGGAQKAYDVTPVRCQSSDSTLYGTERVERWAQPTAPGSGLSPSGSWQLCGKEGKKKGREGGEKQKKTEGMERRKRVDRRCCGP